MVTTRSQNHEPEVGEKRKAAEPKVQGASPEPAQKAPKEQSEDESSSNLTKKEQESSNPSSKPTDKSNESFLNNPPRSTAKELGLETPLKNDANTIFTLLLAAELSSARISHDLAFKTARAILKEGWGDVHKLRESTWQRRTEVLTEGGYAHYRERSATFLGDVAELVVEKWDGDLNNLFKAADGDNEKLRQLLKELKGVGEVCVDIFCRDAQVFWDFLVPFADKKALAAAEKHGIGSTPEELYEAVGKDKEKLANLCTSLTLGSLES